MKIEKKHVIAAGLATISLAAAYAYLQYKKLLNYAIGFKSARIKTITDKLIDFDLFLKFQNKSDTSFIIQSQDYDVYINDMFVSKVVNYSKTTINPKNVNGGLSIVGVNVKFNPKDVLKKLGKNPVELISNPGAIRIKVPMKLKVDTKILFIPLTVSADYTYESTLKELLTSPKE